MNSNKYLVIIGTAAFIFWAAYTYGGIIGVGFICALILAWLGWQVYQRSYVTLNEMQVGVVFNHKGNFVCFLDNDYGRIIPNQSPKEQKKPLTRHKITPFQEKMTGIIPKGGQKAEGKMENFRTAEGIPVKLKWSVSFKIIVTKIPENLKYKMARGLPENAPKMVTGKVEHALHHIIEQTKLQDLYSLNGEYGALQSLEIELRNRVRELTAIYGADIGDRDVSLGPVEFPPEFENALQNKFKLELQSRTLVNWSRS